MKKNKNKKPLGKFTQKQVDKINKRRKTEHVPDLTPAQEAEENITGDKKPYGYSQFIKEAKDFCAKTSFIQQFYGGDIEKALSQACGFSHASTVPKNVSNGTIRISYITTVTPEPGIEQLESIFVRNVDMAITEFLGEPQDFPKELLNVLAAKYDIYYLRMTAIEELEQNSNNKYLKHEKLWQSNDNNLILRSTHDILTNDDFTLIDTSKYIGDKELLAISCIQGVVINTTDNEWKMYSHENFNKFCYAMHCTIEDELKIVFGTSDIEKTKQELLWLNELYTLLPTSFAEPGEIIETNLVNAMKITYNTQSIIDEEYNDLVKKAMKEEDVANKTDPENTPSLNKGNFYDQKYE